MPYPKNDWSTVQREIVSAVVDGAHVPWPALCDPGRGPGRTADARRVLMVLLYQDCRMSYAQIGRFVGRSTPTVRESVLKFYSDRTAQQGEILYLVNDTREAKFHDAARRHTTDGDTTDDGDVGYIPAPGPAADLTGYELPPPPP